MREKDLAPPVRRYLEGQGYTVWVDPDGADYLDVVARRGEELGLVELKLADWKGVFRQAIRRRGWADWVAVVLPRESLARRLLDRRQAPRSERVGVWVVTGDSLTIVRPARPLWGADEAHPFPDLKADLLRVTDLLASGELPAGVGWSLPGARGGLPGRRRSTRDWRLEEFPDR